MFVIPSNARDLGVPVRAANWSATKFPLNWNSATGSPSLRANHPSICYSSCS